MATASAARTEANRAELDAQNLRNFSTTFNTWFTAYIAGDSTAEAVAVRRFRPPFKVAFDAWLATDPFTNANAPPGPTYMHQYKQPELAVANALDRKATEDYSLGVQAGSNADNYIRDTIYLATILFLVGISGHFHFFRILAVPRVTRRARVPVAVTADRGYGEVGVEDELKSIGVHDVVLPTRGKPNAARRLLESQPGFQELVRWRTGCEGRISCLKRDFGWNRTCMDGIEGARTWSGHGVFNHDLVKIAGLMANG